MKDVHTTRDILLYLGYTMQFKVYQSNDNTVIMSFVFSQSVGSYTALAKLRRSVM